MQKSSAKFKRKSPSFRLLPVVILLLLCSALLFSVGLLLKKFRTSELTSQASAPVDLRVVGTSLTKTDGTRFIIRGMNLEYFRDQGCSAITDGQYLQRVAIAQRLYGLGVNTVRLNYNRYNNWLGQSGNMTKYLDMMQTLTQYGIYVMPSDHIFTGASLNGRANSYPLFQQIVAGARARGFESYLILNPYNEPGPQDTQAQWVTANKDTLSYLRTTLGFRGVVVLDTLSWATDFNTSSMQSILTYDAGLLGGNANVIFSHHWYPNNAMSVINNTLNNAGNYPLLIGELGQINPGQTGVVPTYVTDVFNALISTGIPRGHNGAIPWIWNWCDQNAMTNSDYLTLNTYGNLVNTSFFSRFPAPPPLPSPTPTPYVLTLQGTSQNASADTAGQKAIDGIATTSWSAGGTPTQWIRVKLPATGTVSKLRLTPNQYPAGATIHKIYASATLPTSGHGTLVRTLSTTLTSGQPYDVVFSPEIGNVQYITIETTSSPSWVSWSEIQAFPGTGAIASPLPTASVTPSPVPTPVPSPVPSPIPSPSPVPTPSPSPSPSPTPYTLTIQSVSQTASADFAAVKSIDGIVSTSWSSGGSPIQWIRLKLPATGTVSKIRLTPNQYPAGATIHKIYTSPTVPTSGHGTLVRTLSTTLTSGQPYDVVFSPALTNVQYVTIETTSSPSWVAWSEILMYP